MFCFPTYFAHHEKKKISPLMGQALDGLSKEHSYKNTHKKIFSSSNVDTCAGLLW